MEWTRTYLADKSCPGTLCLDATSDARRNIFKARPGCTMTANKVAGGYGALRFLDLVGAIEITKGSPIGGLTTAHIWV